MLVGDQDILLPTTLVGSYPRPAFMTGPVFGAGVDDKEFPTYRMREFYRDAIALTTKDLTDAGIDIVTDGAQHYEHETDWELAELFHTLPHHLEGFLPYGDNVVLGSNELAVYKPTVVSPVAWRRPIFKPVLDAVRAATDKPLKINVGLGPRPWPCSRPTATTAATSKLWPSTSPTPTTPSSRTWRREAWTRCSSPSR